MTRVFRIKSCPRIIKRGTLAKVLKFYSLFGKIKHHLTYFERNCAFSGVLNIDRKVTFPPNLEAVNISKTGITMGIFFFCYGALNRRV